MKHTIIYNNILNKLVILDSNNQILTNQIISDDYLLNDIDFSTLPTNVLNDVKLYLGKEYESYNNVDINEILELLFNKDNIIDDKGYHRNKNDDYLYKYDQKSECLYFSYDNIYSVFESKYQLKDRVIRCLVSSMVEQSFKWKVVTTSILNTLQT